AILLSLLLDPSKLYIFPFITGLLGIGQGWGLRMLKRRGLIILINGWLLLAGICIPVIVFDFPALGAMSISTGILELLGIFIFSMLYSWLWLEFSLFFIKRWKWIILP